MVHHHGAIQIFEQRLIVELVERHARQARQRNGPIDELARVDESGRTEPELLAEQVEIQIAHRVFGARLDHQDRREQPSASGRVLGRFERSLASELAERPLGPALEHRLAPLGIEQLDSPLGRCFFRQSQVPTQQMPPSGNIAGLLFLKIDADRIAGRQRQGAMRRLALVAIGDHFEPSVAIRLAAIKKYLTDDSGNFAKRYAVGRPAVGRGLRRWHGTVEQEERPLGRRLVGAGELRKIVGHSRRLRVGKEPRRKRLEILDRIVTAKNAGLVDGLGIEQRGERKHSAASSSDTRGDAARARHTAHAAG